MSAGRGDLPRDTFVLFLVKDPKSARFYLLLKIHERLYGMAGRPVILSCACYTENISFLDHYL